MTTVGSRLMKDTVGCPIRIRPRYTAMRNWLIFLKQFCINLPVRPVGIDVDGGSS